MDPEAPKFGAVQRRRKESDLEHFTKLTVSASLWCSKCQKFTDHRIDGGRKGPCLACIARLESAHVAKPKVEADRQIGLWGDAS